MATRSGRNERVRKATQNGLEIAANDPEKEKIIIG
jgi:hypothetical protein